AATGIDLLITASDDGVARYAAGVHLLNAAAAHRGGDGGPCPQDHRGDILPATTRERGVQCRAPAADSFVPVVLDGRAVCNAPDELDAAACDLRAAGDAATVDELFAPHQCRAPLGHAGADLFLVCHAAG